MSMSFSYFLVLKLPFGKGFLLINAGHRPRHHHLLPFAEELVMDLKYITVSDLINAPL